MKKFIITLCVTLMAVTNAFAMSTSSIREHARFLTDRMAYELDMTPRQYEDCYEVNFDFIYSVNSIMRDVCYGYGDAIDMYYTYLDYRNDDLHYILTSRQYAQFLTLDYFYRPIYTYRGDWMFRVYQVYNNRKFFYFDAPTIYRSYAGAHARKHHQNGFYGNKRYTHEIAPKYGSLRSDKNYGNHSRNDFGQNRRDRGTKQVPNGYNNRNQDNREKDSRYHDERKGQNHNTPEINNRNNQQGNNGHGNAAPNNGNKGGSNAGNQGNKGGNGGNKGGNNQPRGGHNR